MSSSSPQRPRRWKAMVTIGVTALLFGGGISAAVAADEGTTPGVISCPAVDVASLGAVPASAEAEVERNLALLNTQIAEANNRLRSSVGQGGPNFVQNAILGPLASKRGAAIDRIAISIGRKGTRPNLNIAALSRCSVVEAGAAEQPVDVAPEDGADAGGDDDGAGGQDDQGAGGQDDEDAGGQDDEDAGGAGAGQDDGVGTITCPALDLALLGNIPASAAAEVRSNLAQLENQIAEANARLRSSVGQGGPNFVQNAILGPLADKRTAAINRIATAIGRQGVRPNLPVAALSRCSVTGG